MSAIGPTISLDAAKSAAAVAAADGKLVGAIGVSGDLSEHDGQCANSAAAAIK